MLIMHFSFVMENILKETTFGCKSVTPDTFYTHISSMFYFPEREGHVKFIDVTQILYSV